MLQTKREENGVNGDSEECSTEEVSSGGESAEAEADAARSPQFLLEKAPQPTPRLTREVRVLPAMVLPMPKRNKNGANQNGRKDSASEEEFHTPAGKGSPPSSHQKPPLPPMVSPRGASTSPSQDPSMSPSNDSIEPVQTLSRSNSIG